MHGSVGVHVRREDAVIAFGPERAIQQRIDVQREALAGLVGHLRRGLVDVDESPVQFREAHRHAGAGEHPGHVVHPGRRPVVVVRVETDAVRQRDLRLRVVVAPGDAVGAVRSRRWERSGTCAAKRGDFVGVDLLQRSGV